MGIIEAYLVSRYVCLLNLLYFQFKAWCVGCLETHVTKYTLNSAWKLSPMECNYYGKSCVDYLFDNRLISVFRDQTRIDFEISKVRKAEEFLRNYYDKISAYVRKYTFFYFIFNIILFKVKSPSQVFIDDVKKLIPKIDSFMNQKPNNSPNEIHKTIYAGCLYENCSQICNKLLVYSKGGVDWEEFINPGDVTTTLRQMAAKVTKVVDPTFTNSGNSLNKNTGLEKIAKSNVKKDPANLNPYPNKKKTGKSLLVGSLFGIIILFFNLI